MTFNVWQPQGQYLTSLPAEVGNPSIIYDSNPQILAGPNVFKLWVGLDSSGMLYYYESATAAPNTWTAYSGNPITASPNNAFFPTVYKEGSTYYLYGNDGFGTPLNIYTSTNGVSWTYTGVQIPLGGVGAADHGGVFQLNICDIVNGTWYGYYSSLNGAQTHYTQSLATSTDGIHWTKSPNNPIFDLGPGFNINNSCFLKANGGYYMYAGFYDSIPTVLAPNYRIGRWSSPAPTGPWTRLEYNGVPVPTYYSAAPGEFNSSGNALPNIAPNDQRMCVANGNIYMFYTVTENGGTEFGVASAVATGYTPEQLVATYEGVQNVPFTGLTALNRTTVASDNFQRADANPIGGNWTPTLAGQNCKIVSDVVNPSTVGTLGNIYWNANAFSNDQWSETTLQAAVSTSFVGPKTRGNTSGVYTQYHLLIGNGFGTGGGGSGTFAIGQHILNGTATNLNIQFFTIAQGDTLMIAAVGTSVMMFWNDQLIWNQTDASIASGASGLALTDSANTANAAINQWSGGGFTNPPTIPNPFPPIPSSAYSVPDCRNFGGFPNNSVNVNGTLTYTIQQSESRKAGAPVDSRTTKPTASGTYPQNSRTPGTFGPGE